MPDPYCIGLCAGECAHDWVPFFFVFFFPSDFGLYVLQACSRLSKPHVS